MVLYCCPICDKLLATMYDFRLKNAGIFPNEVVAVVVLPHSFLKMGTQWNSGEN